MNQLNDPFAEYYIDQEPTTTTAEDPFSEFYIKEAEPFSFKEIPGYLGQSLKETAIHGAKGVAKGLGTLGSLYEMASVKPEGAKQIIPTSEDIGKFLEYLGVPKEAKTVAGRTAGRIGEFVGGGAIFGAPALVPSAVAGTVGQALEEAGAPKWAQAAGEIVTFLKTGKHPKGVLSSSPELQEHIKDLKNLGFSDQDITLAKNALEKRGLLKKVSKETGKTQKVFEESFKNIGEKFNEQLVKVYPGLEEGIPSMKEVASEILNNVTERAKDLVISKPTAFADKIENIVEDLQRTLANTPEEKQVIELLNKAMIRAEGGQPGDFFINFYRGLNQIGNWTNPKQRERVFRTVKNAIKDAFRDQGPEGKALATDFEKANEAWMKMISAQDVTDLLKKGMTDNGIDFKKMSSLLENKINYDSLVKNLGKEQTNNLKKIAEAGKDIGDLEKKIQGGKWKELFNSHKKLELLTALATVNPLAIKGVIAKLAGHEALGRLANRFLTDPKFQSLSLKSIESIKNNKPLVAKSLIDAFEEKIEKEI